MGTFIDNNKFLFVKNESSLSVTSKGYSNYSGLGGKFVNPKFGNLETVLAIKPSDKSISGFIEGKYSTHKIGNSNIAFESRTRAIVGKDYGENKTNIGMTQRFASKYSNKLTEKVGLYEIAGLNSNVSFQGDGLKSLTPTSITGVDIKLKDKFSMYTELELSKSYDMKNKKWEDLSSGVYLGFKYTF